MQCHLISLTVFLIAFFGISPVQMSTKYAYTNKNKLCMTGCEPYSSYNYCYLGWGSSYWDYCTPGTIPAPQYYTAFVTVARDEQCTSLCGYFGSSTSDGTWCFTGSRGRWDYCSKSEGVTIYGNVCTGACSQGRDRKFTCPVGHGQPTLEACSKSPDDSEFVKLTSDLISSLHGNVSNSGDFQTCPARGKRANEDLLRAIGVNAVYDHYVLFMTVRNINNPAVPVTSYVTGQAPVRNNVGDIDLTYAMRARIYPRHRSVRTAIPGFVAQRFVLLDAYEADERGHLLAASLGGPNDPENFLPQTSILNRANGGDSFWFRIEGEIRSLLDGAPGNNVAYIDWTLVVTYGNTRQDRRPTGYGLRFIARNAAGGVIRDSGDMFFSNDVGGGACI